jgi:predicted nucleic acid-binding protein
MSATALPRRSNADLTFLRDETQLAGRRLLLDACVYIDMLQAQLPVLVERLFTMRAVHHSALAMAEVSFPIGRLDPADPRTEGVKTAIEEILSAIRPDRIAPLDASTTMEGSIRAGVMARLLTYDKASQRKALTDATIATQAARNGLTVLTRNVADFDRLSQLDPRLDVLFYEREALAAKLAVAAAARPA